MKNLLRIGMLLCSFLLASVGWAMAQENGGGTTEIITTLDGLKTAIQNATGDNPTITLAGDITNADAETGPAITIDKALTLDGNNHTISGSAAENIISIIGTGTVTIKNVTIQNEMGTSTAHHNDVTVYRRGIENTNAVTFQNVTFAGNGWIGLVVNGSAVTVDGITDNDTHVWGTINLENRAKGQANIDPKLTIDQTTTTPNTLNGLLQIYVDSDNTSSDDFSSWVTDQINSFNYLSAAKIWTSRFEGGQYTIPVPKGRTSHARELLLFMDIINNAETSISTVALGAGTYTLDKQLVIKKKLTLKGQGPASDIILEANPNANWPKDKGNIINSSANLISIEALGSSTDGSTVDLMNLTIRKSMASGINAQSQIRTHLNLVNLEENKNAGLLVHSQVDVDNVHTKLNGWGAINVDKGDPDYGTTSLKVDSYSTFEEIVKIWGEGYDTNYPDKHFTDVREKVDMPAGWSCTYDESKNMYFWTNAKMTQETIDGITYVYANGNPVTVAASTEAGKTTITSDSQVLTFDDSTDKVYLFGGSKDASVENTSIKMKGGKLTQIYGGGYGSSTNADVTSTTGNGIASIYITGGEIERIIGGGRFKATTEQVDLTIEGENTKIYRIYAGGWSNSATRAETWNEAETKTGIVNINISRGATIMNAFGCGGGFGYTYTGISFVRIFDAVLGDFKGTYANGYADEIDAEIYDCTFKPFFWKGSTSAYYELGTTNRGVVNNATFTFKGCHFEDTSNEVTTSQPMKVCIGVVEGWGDSDTDGDPIPAVKGSVSYTFDNCTNTPQVVIGEGMDNANVTLSGASAILRKYHRGDNITESHGDKEKNSFAIKAGKTWTFNNGLTFATGEDAATLTNNGTLIVKGVDSEANLQAAVAMGADTIKLAATDFELTQQLTISKSVALVGTTVGEKTSTIKYGTFTGGTDLDSKHMISVLADNVLLQNLVVDGTGYATKNNSGSAINVYTATGVVLDNVVAKNTIAAGLIVNGSEVTATNFHTEGNGWYGVNVDKGLNVTETPKFTIGNNCSFAETTAIKADSRDAASSWVVGDGWVMVSKTENEETFKIWQNAAAQGINYAIISVPTTVVYGDENLPLLSNITAEESEITFAVVEGSESVEIETVEGKQTLKIKKPGKATLSLEYKGVTVTQAVEVLKRTITVSGITAKNKTYNGKKDVEVTDQEPEVSGTLEKEPINFSYTYELDSADAGDAVPVKITVTATGMAEGKNFGDYYTVAVAPVTAKVNKKNLTVTTDNITAINFGTPLPTFTASYSGFENSESEGVLSGTLQFDCPATSSSLAGTYKVTPYGLTSNNYAIKYEGADLTINAVKPTVEIVSATVSNNNSTVTVKGHVTNNGGTKTTDLTGGFKVDETEKASGLKVDENGYFEKTLEGLSGNVSIVATAGIDNLSGSSTATTVNLSLIAQNVRFVTNLSRLVYGSKVTLDAAVSFPEKR